MYKNLNVAGLEIAPPGNRPDFKNAKNIPALLCRN